MKVLGICGSPRRGGNTEVLLDRALEGAVSRGAVVEKIILEDLDISPCRQSEYEEVSAEGLSIVDDDIHVIFRKIKEADALILASPIFFGSLSAQTKTMIDRFQCVWVAKNAMAKNVFSRKMPGGFISAEATKREDFFANARSIVKHFFATISVSYAGDVLCPGVDKKGSVLERQDCLEKAFELGASLAGGLV